MVDYLAMKSYLEKNNLHCFIFSINSEKPIKEIIHHLPPKHANGRYFQQPLGLRLQRHQCKANDGHSKSTQRPNPHGNPPSILCYLDN